MFEDRVLSYASSTPTPTAWRITCRASASGPRPSSGLCVERSPEMVVGLMGILKPAGAYLPLDPDYPRERLAFMLADAGAAVLVTQQALLDRLPDNASAQLVRLDADWPAIARQPDTAPPLELDPAHPAYVIYTSGSTGTPKGVVVGHGGLPHLARGPDRPLCNYSARSCFAVASPSFDAAVSEIATALMGRATH